MSVLTTGLLIYFTEKLFVLLYFQRCYYPTLPINQLFVVLTTVLLFYFTNTSGVWLYLQPCYYSTLPIDEVFDWTSNRATILLYQYLRCLSVLTTVLLFYFTNKSFVWLYFQRCYYPTSPINQVFDCTYNHATILLYEDIRCLIVLTTVLLFYFTNKSGVGVYLQPR